MSTLHIHAACPRPHAQSENFPRFPRFPPFCLSFPPPLARCKPRGKMKRNADPATVSGRFRALYPFHSPASGAPPSWIPGLEGDTGKSRWTRRGYVRCSVRTGSETPVSSHPAAWTPCGDGTHSATLDRLLVPRRGGLGSCGLSLMTVS